MAAGFDGAALLRPGSEFSYSFLYTVLYIPAPTQIFPWFPDTLSFYYDAVMDVN